MFKTKLVEQIVETNEQQNEKVECKIGTTLN